MPRRPLGSLQSSGNCCRSCSFVCKLLQCTNIFRGPSSPSPLHGFGLLEFSQTLYLLLLKKFDLDQIAFSGRAGSSCLCPNHPRDRAPKPRWFFAALSPAFRRSSAADQFALGHRPRFSRILGVRLCLFRLFASVTSRPIGQTPKPMDNAEVGTGTCPKALCI